MIKFSNNPKLAERQMRAIIFYLTTFGYIDGDFDDSERAFVLQFIEQLVADRVESGLPDGEASTKRELKRTYTQHFREEFERIDQFILDMFSETTATDEDQQTFVQTRLKLKCFEIFKSFDLDTQESLMDIVDELLVADGVVHPSEVKFRGELAALLEEDLGVQLIEGDEEPAVQVGDMVELHPQVDRLPFFDAFEQHYSGERDVLRRQLAQDEALIAKTLELFEQQRQGNSGRLTGKTSIKEVEGESPFLDGHVYVIPTPTSRRYDVTVLGDLHGCYSCLKAAVMQSGFFEKVEAFRRNPVDNPDPKLVLLGDYIDRGLFSLNGVLRGVMQIFHRAPEHVYILRGNHENYFEYKGEIYGGVKPAEAINSLKPHVNIDILRQYRQLFDQMPNMLLFGETLFVHGGIPKDLTIKARYKDLGSLNDDRIRFEMLWSDPSMADVVPAALQQPSARFPFGKHQAAAFLQRLGCRTIVRGHEKVLDGFDHTYNEPNVQLFTLFSCGGRENEDLLPGSGFRKITPMAMTLHIEGNDVSLSPWKIDYKPYNSADKNAFFKDAPQIEHVSG